MNEGRTTSTSSGETVTPVEANTKSPEVTTEQRGGVAHVSANMLFAPPHGISNGDPSTIPNVPENVELIAQLSGSEEDSGESEGDDEQDRIDHELGKKRFLEILERNKQTAIAKLNEIRARAEADPTLDIKQEIKNSDTLLAQLSDETIANIAVTLPNTTGSESIYNTFKADKTILQEFGELNDAATRAEMGIAG
jgi:hypothetical protein